LQNSSSELKAQCNVGSQEWANDLLREGIRECHNDGRAWPGVNVWVLHLINLLQEHGFHWQAQRLRNHLHLAKRRRRLAALKELTSARESRGAH
jgi:hypothetical protein